MSRPHSACLLTTSATASFTAACNSARRAPGLFSSASSNSTTFCVRGRLPVCVVRIRPILKPAHHLDDMLDIRRCREAMADELAPFVEIRRFTEILGVIFQRFPLHEQPVALWHLVRALQGHELAAFGALEDRPGLFYAGFKFGFHAGLYVDLGNFEDHGNGPYERGEGRTLLRGCGRGKISHAIAYLPRPKKRSFWSSVALSRTDLSVATWARARLTASRVAILSTHFLTVGYLAGSMANSSKLRSHGHAAMSAIV